MSALNDLVRRFKRGAGPAQEQGDAKQPFDWEPERVMPAKARRPEPRRREEEAPAAAAPVASPPPMSWKPVKEPSSVVGGTIPADVADFATVYKGASVQGPSHGYGVDRVGEMLAHQSLAGLDKAVKASAVLAALDAARVSIAEVIHDGLVRYKALVAFEAAKELELHQVRPANERRVAELKAAVDGFQRKMQAEIDALTRESASAAAVLTRLETRQRAEEERFHRTVSLFVEALPARVIPMAPRPPEPPPAQEAKPTELKLVAPAPEAQKSATPAPGAPTDKETKS
jgi:hypothetical protein